jgi:hypothetical protein
MTMLTASILTFRRPAAGLTRHAGNKLLRLGRFGVEKSSTAYLLRSLGFYKKHFQYCRIRITMPRRLGQHGDNSGVVAFKLTALESLHRHSSEAGNPEARCGPLRRAICLGEC